jgi:hypothetical protein
MFWVRFWKGRLASLPFFFTILSIAITMAIIRKGILGAVQGKIDGLVGQIKWGQPTIVNAREDYTWSSETEFQRAKMSKLCEYGNLIGKSDLTWMYPDSTKKLTSWMRFIKQNYSKMDSSLGLHLDEEFIPKWQISRAQRLPNLSFRIARLANSAVLGYSFRYGANMNTTDRMYILISWPTLGEIEWRPNVGARSANSYFFGTTTKALGTPYEAVIIFRSLDGTMVSQARKFSGVVVNS